MVEKMRKAKKPNRKLNDKSLNQKNHKKRTGPRLPNSLRRELDRINPDNHEFDSEEEDDVIVSDEDVNDVYEYEEGLPEEESKKNRRYDQVENYEYQLPEDFKDENVQSDDDDSDDGYDGDMKTTKKRKIDGVDDDDIGEEDDERHMRMLQGITGMPTEAFDGKKKKNVVLSEAYPESEFNPSRDVLDGDGRVSIEDLLGSLQGTSVYSQLRKRTSDLQKKSAPLHAPLPKRAQEKVERQGAYQLARKDITKWEPIVARNREAPAIIFDRDIDLAFSTVGAIASEFEPRTEFEKKMASLVNDDKVAEAHKKDGARLLELNKVSAEEIKDKWNHIAKMRNLLFRHEVKMKRVKKIKSKVYRRLLKKDRFKASSLGMQLDPEEAKEEEMKRQRDLATERMTLRHKNHSKWARRKIERGLNVQDDGTREAIAEQLRLHALLTRKTKSMNESSSDESSDEEDENSAGSDHERQQKILARGKEKTLKVLEEEDEVPNSGVLSLPFMVRGLKKRKEEAVEEARHALQEYESSMNQLEDSGAAENTKVGSVSGRRVFGASKMQETGPNHKIRSDDTNGDSDNEDESIDEEEDFSRSEKIDQQKDVKDNAVTLGRDSEAQRDSMFKNVDQEFSNTGPKTTFEVALFASGSWRKMKGQNEGDTNMTRSPEVAKPVVQGQGTEEASDYSDMEGEEQMVDGILLSSPKSSYQLPSQDDLIREAFAGDDVEDEFKKEKEELLDEENPEPEKPILLPGWGQWTEIQRKKGVPSWMREEHEVAKRKREEALNKRKDAHLKNVIISEKLDKKAEKLHTKALPYPFRSKEVFEHNMRMPIGPEFNPATAVGALNRPDVVKRPGLIIKPIKYEDVDPYERKQHKMAGKEQKQKSKPKPRIKSHRGGKPVVAKS